jgi:geranylgeranyl pyrophosphate synthase
MTETASVYGPVADDVPLVGERLREIASGHHQLLGDALGHIFGSGGKRIRPALVLLSGKLGVYDRQRLITLAASLEVVHTATLVHDDTIDEALTRRGLPTISAVWDGKVAILIGDFLLALSASLASELDSVRIMKMLSETVMAMSSGELRQYASTSGREIDEAGYFQRIAGKTASLFAMCCEGAGVVGEQSEVRIAALRDFGMNLGIAFQIADDVLDFIGDEQSLGKPAGSDLRNGTITLPVIMLAERLSSDSSLRKDIEAGTNVDRVIEAVRSSGTLDASLGRASAYSTEALRALEVFPESAAKDALIALSAQVTKRTS